MFTSIVFRYVIVMDSMCFLYVFLSRKGLQMNDNQRVFSAPCFLT